MPAADTALTTLRLTKVKIRPPNPVGVLDLSGKNPCSTQLPLTRHLPDGFDCRLDAGMNRSIFQVNAHRRSSIDMRIIRLKYEYYAFVLYLRELYFSCHGSADHRCPDANVYACSGKRIVVGNSKKETPS
jgi:hypothetical protein